MTSWPVCSPVADGENWTVTVQLAPGRTGPPDAIPQVSVATENWPVPAIVNADTTNGIWLELLITVTVSSGVLLAPLSEAVNRRLLGLIVGGGGDCPPGPGVGTGGTKTPCPNNATDCGRIGLLCALSVKTSAALAGPNNVGENVTCTVQVPPGGTLLVLQLS